MADLMEQHMPQLFDLAVREAGKTLNNAIAEVREAVDFVAIMHKKHVNSAMRIHHVVLWWQLAPWNFPLAILLAKFVLP